MATCKGSMRHLYRLEAITDDVVDAANESFDSFQPDVLDTVWCSSSLGGADDPQPLLVWFGPAIGKTICVWQPESDQWEKKLQKRRDLGFRMLTPQQQQACNFEQWCAISSPRSWQPSARTCCCSSSAWATTLRSSWSRVARRTTTSYDSCKVLASSAVWIFQQTWTRLQAHAQTHPYRISYVW